MDNTEDRPYPYPIEVKDQAKFEQEMALTDPRRCFFNNPDDYCHRVSFFLGQPLQQL